MQSSAGTRLHGVGTHGREAGEDAPRPLAAQLDDVQRALGDLARLEVEEVRRRVAQHAVEHDLHPVRIAGVELGTRDLGGGLLGVGVDDDLGVDARWGSTRPGRCGCTRAAGPCRGACCRHARRRS